MKNYKIVKYEEQKATEEELEGYYDFFMEILAEARPDEPKRPYDKFIKQVLVHSKSMLVKRWVIWEKEKIIAYAIIYKTLDGENQHFPEVDIFVLPDFRRQGVGNKMLAKLNEECIKLDCTKLEFSTFSNTPCGSEFLTAIGAEKCSTEYVNQMAVKDLDIDLMNAWISKASERATDYEIELWIDEYPESEIEGFTKLYNDFWNSIPTGSLDYEYEELTPERLRNGMESKIKRGWKNWIMVAKQKTTGEYAGFTSIYYTGFNPEMVNQGNTGVAIKHRNKGLGRWLKAALIKHVLTEMPNLKKIRSENDVTNKPMLNINNQMGFKSIYSESYWQITTDKVNEYLKK
jgi:mycothiol synthase